MRFQLCQNLIAELSLRTKWHVIWHLHVISARCVARDLHTIAPGPLEHTCWRQFAALWGDCKKSRIAPLNVIIIIIIIMCHNFSIMASLWHGNTLFGSFQVCSGCLLHIFSFDFVWKYDLVSGKLRQSWIFFKPASPFSIFTKYFQTLFIFVFRQKTIFRLQYVCLLALLFLLHFVE